MSPGKPTTSHGRAAADGFFGVDESACDGPAPSAGARLCGAGQIVPCKPPRQRVTVILPGPAWPWTIALTADAGASAPRRS